MQFVVIAALAALLAPSTNAAAAPLKRELPAPSLSEANANSTRVMQQMQATYKEHTLQLLAAQHYRRGCTKAKLSIRKSFSALTTMERIAYLKAATCLHEKPSQTTDQKLVPGAINRMDDFTYAHINQTDFIHNSGLLLPWHREFVWTYEQALRIECGYSGPMPYWDWAEHAENQTQSPIFDDSPTSFGGNGVFIPHGPLASAPIPGLAEPRGPPPRPAGNGGGCASLGGLGANWTVTLGPVSPGNNSNATLQSQYGLLRNTRCLKRDFLQSVSSSNLNVTSVLAVLQQPNIHAFHPLMEHTQHLWAHDYVGLDLGDLFTSPNDPVFYLLHAQIDRLWTIWQGQDYTTRLNGLDGTLTFFNDPPTANATLRSVMNFAGLIPEERIANVMSTISGKYCYMYE